MSGLGAKAEVLGEMAVVVLELVRLRFSLECPIASRGSRSRSRSKSRPRHIDDIGSMFQPCLSAMVSIMKSQEPIDKSVFDSHIMQTNNNFTATQGTYTDFED